MASNFGFGVPQVDDTYGFTPTIPNQTASNAMTPQANSMVNSSNPYVQAAQATSAGNLANAQQATAANRINQSTPYGSLQYQQTGTDANGNPIWSANQTLAPELQGTFNNLTTNLQNTTANPFDASQYNAGTSQGYTGMEGWDKATQLLNQRLQPQMAQSAESQKAALANQGIVPGTAAYDNAMRTFNQGQNDLLTQTQLAGSTLQNQLQSQSLAQQQANNSALGQNFTQNFNAYNNPLNQLNSFKNATTPGYVNPYSQATVTGPDYLQAYNASQAAAIAQQNAANAKTANTQSGLYGLGSALLQGSGGLTGLANAATTGLSGLSSLGSGISNWWNSLGFGNSGLTSGMSNGGVTGNIYDDYGNLMSSGNAAPAAADFSTAFNDINWR